MTDERNPERVSDSEARRRICEDLDATLIVEAAAGTGKTTMLVSRIIAILRAGKAELDRIIAVTFTEKAAGEMKLRLRAAIEAARTALGLSELERTRLDRALAHLEVARIGTIHSLCADLLREHPVEAAIDPLFEVMPEEEAQRTFEVCFDGWFDDILGDPPEGIRRILRRRPHGRDAKGPRTLLREAAWKLVDQRDFLSPYKREPLDRSAALDAAMKAAFAFGQLADRASRPDDFLPRIIRQVHVRVAEIQRAEQVRGRDYDALEAELFEMAKLPAFRIDIHARGGFGPGITRVDIARERDETQRLLKSTLDACSADLAACLKAELGPVVARYDAQKARAGKLDFLDLLLRARDLVRDHRSVREELEERIHRIFVDEFQDTDPLQAEILLRLAETDLDEVSLARVHPVPGKLFFVGDPKQSIYRFRRADVAFYEMVKDRLLVAGAELLYLTKNFRSVATIQRAVNVAFEEAMATSPSRAQAAYVPLEPHRPDFDSQPGLVALPVPRPYSDWGRLTERAVRESLPDAVGAYVEWLVRDSQWIVSERDRQEHLAPRHICLLFKRFQAFGEDITRSYVRALEARRIPHVLVGGRSFYDREEVAAMQSAMQAIEWPDDALSVYATLRGPFFAFTDEALLAYRVALAPLGSDRPEGLNPLFVSEERLANVRDDDGTLHEVAGALGILRSLHISRNRRPIASTLEQLLSETRAHAGVAIWPTGEQALANLLRILDMARRFEAASAMSFRSFVERLEREAESGSTGEAPVVEEGTEGVRIMTVHRAKGLEFPVVILADPTAPLTHERPSRYVDPERGLWAESIAGHMPRELLEHQEEVLALDRAEAVRLAYVAATRARDLLVVPAVGDEPRPGWLDVLNPVLYPEPSERRAPSRAPSCPRFGDDSVLERPIRVERGPDSSVAPGLHQSGRGRVPVVWWDPSILGLGKEPEGGLRQQRILAADTSRSVSMEGATAHRVWAAGRTDLLIRGGRTTIPVRTVTELVAQPVAWTANDRNVGLTGPVEIVTSMLDRRARPRGKRFGTLVHAVLAVVDLDAEVDAITRSAESEGRILGASTEEIVAATTAVAAALAHPLMRRAAVAARHGECRRETEILLQGNGSDLVEGVVDLAFRESGPRGGIWTVIDFKTDRDLSEKRDRYEAQVRLYMQAISVATGETATGVLFAV